MKSHGGHPNGKRRVLLCWEYCTAGEIHITHEIFAGTEVMGETRRER
jgi:hypothetical protein